MQRTEGFAKGFMSVFYSNTDGVKHHMMDFQICTVKCDGSFSAVDACRETVQRCEYDRTKLPSYVRDALTAVVANGYDLTITFSVMV